LTFTYVIPLACLSSKDGGDVHWHQAVR